MRVPRHLLRDRVTVEPYEGAGSRGPSYGTPVENVRASVQPSSRLIQTVDGRTVPAELLVIIRPEQDFPVESRVTWRERQYRVLQAMPMPDEFRPTHRELVLGRLG